MNYSSTDTDTDTMTYIEEPNENDILLGRGGKNNQWTGNDGLRTMAHSRCIEYQTAQKRAKSEISRELVEGVQNLDPPGRFLRKCSNLKGSVVRWEVATDKVAREKTSQVLRDAIHAKKLLNSLGERNTGVKASPNSKDDADDDADDDDDDDAGSGSSSTTAGSSVAKEKGKDDVHNKMKNTTGSVSSSTTTGSSVGKVKKEEGEELHNKIKRTPVKQSSEQGRRSLPAPAPASASASVTSICSSNDRLPMGNRPTEHTFSPDTFPLPHPYNSSYGYSSYGRVPISEASLNRRYSREDVTNFAMGSSSFPYQYPVTPSSSNIAISTAKKRRQRYCQESPLVHGYHHYDPYHQYPYPTPIGLRQNAAPPTGMRPVSMGTSPPNTKLRGLEFSPPAIPMHGMLSEHSCNAPFSSDRRNSSSLSLSQITVKQGDDYTNNEMGRGLVFTPPAISVHGMISGNSCSSVDTPFSSDKRSSSSPHTTVKQEGNSTTRNETIQLPSASNQQSHLSTTHSSDSNPEFDFLLNDEVLFDSEHKRHSATSFPSDLHDDSI